MIILGVDPGQEHCGIAIVESDAENRVIDREVARHFVFTPFVVKLFEQYCFDLVVCEGIKSYRASYDNGAASTRSIIASLIRTSNIIGQLKMTCHMHKTPLVTYPKDEINRAIHGNSKCSKRELQEIVRLRLGLDKPVRPTHCNDAVAIALYAADQWRLNKLCEETNPAVNPSL